MDSETTTSEEASSSDFSSSLMMLEDETSPPDLGANSTEKESVPKTLKANKSMNTTAAVVDEGVPAAQPRRSSGCLGWFQTMALIRKNGLTKWRTPLPTFFEIFSPVLMMLVLVAAYTLSDIVYKEARIYSDINFDLPGPWLGLVTRSTDLAAGDLGLNRRLVQQTSSENSKVLDPIKIHLLKDALMNLNFAEQEAEEFGRRNLQVLDDDEYDNSTSYDDVFDLLDDARRQLSRVLKSPIAVPTFPQYVAVSSALSSIIDTDDLPEILSDSSYGRQWGNLLTLGTLHLAPDNAMAKEFWSYLNDTYPLLMESNIMKVRLHDTEKKALNFINENLDERTWALLDFGDTEDQDFRYTIRMNYTTLPNTNQITDYVSIGLNTQYQRYYLSGYLTLQRTLNAFSFRRMNVTDEDEVCTSAQEDDFGVWSMPMPTAAYSQNAFFQAVGYLLGLTIAMAYMYPMSRLVKSMVEEKETRMKETLFILGVRPWAHWLSWVLTSLVIFFIITVLVTFTLSSNVLKYSSPVYLFLFILFFSTATMGFSFFVSAFFSRAKLAAIIGPVALFATLLPRFIFFGSNRYEATTGKKIASLLPCTAFAFGADIIADYEYAEQGIQSYNASEGEYSFNTALGFLLFDTLLYMFLGWYLELVIPRQYGVARKWYFLVTPKYWASFFACCFSRNKAREDRYEDGSSDEMSEWSDDDARSEDYERVRDPSLIPRVRIRDLVKRYSKRDDIPPAVDNLNLTMYESQITCLLGHNGAGKTTTISVLTGLFPPTSGDCTIYGNSVIYDLNEARQSMGICPQHNVLFDRLTVTEHLALFERIKGIRPNRAGVRERASEIGLDEYFNTTATALSGGNKRKLSVAIALCGDPQFLILDEPTSGMDPASRRACWELLRQKRMGRVTLLTTHFMDEAELLADRIAVMKEGRLQCCGSGLFLKNRFGLGYNLTVVLNLGSSQQRSADADGLENGQNQSIPVRHSSVVVDHDAVERITNFLKEHIPNTELIRKSARELTYRFPQGTEDLFPAVFDAMEEQRDNLGIGAYGITNTTLEEVFLQLAEEQDENSRRVSEILGLEVVEGVDGSTGDEVFGNMRGEPVEKAVLDDTQPLTIDSKPSQKPPTAETTHMGPLRQVRLLYNKRFIIQKRDIKGFFFMVLLPVILIALVLLVLTIDVQVAGPAIDMDMDLYRKSPSGSSARTDVVVGGGASSSSSDSESVSQAFATMRSNLGPDYEHADFEFNNETTSSRMVSELLLDTINDRTHDARYGAFVFKDAIKVTLRVNWDTMRQDIEDLASFSFDTEETFDVLDWLGVDEDSRPVSWNVSVSDIADWIFELTSLTVDSGLNASALEAATSTALSDILARTSVNDLARAIEWYQDVADAVSDLGSTYRDLANSTEFNETQFAEAVVEFVETMVEVLSDGAVDNLNATNLTAIVENFFDGDGNSTEVVDSVVDFVSDMADLFTDTLNDNFALAENVTSVVDAILSIDDFFSRGAVIKGYEKVIIELNGMIGVGEDVNVTTVVESVFSLLDEAVTNYGNYTAFPNTLLTVPLIVADTLLEQFIEANDNVTITLGDVFGELSEALGGDSDLLDGNVQVYFSSISIDPATMSITVSDLSVESSSQVLFSANGTLSLNNITDEVLSLLPEGTSELTFDINTTASILHNATSPHAVASFNQAYMEYLYKRCSSNIEARLSSVNHPLPLTTQQSLEIKTILSVLASLFILIPFCYILGAFIVFPVKERVSKSKHLQLVSGVNMSAYWVATYLWDLTLFAVLTVGIMMVFLIYGQESAEVFVGTVDSFFATAMLTFGYGMSALPFSYLFSRLFDNHSSAQIAVMGIFFITGFVAVNAYFIMSSIETTESLADSLRPLFRMWPAYNVGEGLINLSRSFWEREVLDEDSNPFDWDIAGKSIALCYLLSVPYFLLLLLLEYSADGGSGGRLGRMLRSLRGSYNARMLKWNGVRKSPDGSLLLDDGLEDDEGETQEDQDVAHEREYVLEHKSELQGTASVLLANLWKVYPPSVGMFGNCMASIHRIVSFICCCGCFRRRQSTPQDDDEDKSNLPKRAVRGLTTAIHEGETYGLLGVNGAGKTTTLGVLTGDITPTGGDAYVAGHDVTGEIPGGVSEARKNIGFCPQVDPLLDLMTGRETLTMFGRLRGIPEEQLHSTVSELMERLTLTPYADKTAESYSGGNKRKLSLGIALIGNPRVLFIDESSSGMDPAARRHMWSLIEEVSQDRSVILTTHSMEEAEALCTRVGIMVHGRLLCLGSVQHLKTTYLDGYTIDVHCVRGTPEDIVDAVQDEILHQALPGSRLAERHGTTMRFDVDSLSALGLGTTFGRLQQLKQNPALCVENYSISQCSLEQVFISLVRRDETQEQEEEPGQQQQEQSVATL